MASVGSMLYVFGGGLTGPDPVLDTTVHKFNAGEIKWQTKMIFFPMICITRYSIVLKLIEIIALAYKMNKTWMFIGIFISKKLMSLIDFGDCSFRRNNKKRVMEVIEYHKKISCALTAFKLS